jgi:hypothetical protein
MNFLRLKILTIIFFPFCHYIEKQYYMQDAYHPFILKCGMSIKITIESKFSSDIS